MTVILLALGVSFFFAPLRAGYAGPALMSFMTIVLQYDPQQVRPFFLFRVASHVLTKYVGMAS